MASYTTRLTRPLHIPPPISIGAIRSDRPRWTNLAQGRLDRSLQSTVCLCPFFYHNLTKYIRPDLCAEFCDFISSCSVAIGNFHLPRDPPVTSAVTTLDYRRRIVRKRLEITTPHYLTCSMPRRSLGPFGITTPSLSYGTVWLSWYVTLLYQPEKAV